MVGRRARRSWTVGRIQRARSLEVLVARRPCPPRPDVRLSPRQYWRCYFNVQRYLSPEVSVHFIFFRLSISGELRTIDFCPEACTCTFVTNLVGHSAIVKWKRKKSTCTSTATDEHRFSLSALSNMHRASNSNQDIVHLSSQEKLEPERACDLKGVRNEQAAWRRYEQRPIDVLVDWMIACTQGKVRANASEILSKKVEKLAFLKQVCGGLLRRFVFRK